MKIRELAPIFYSCGAVIAGVALSAMAIRGCRTSDKVVDGVITVGVAIAQALNEGNITTNFRSSLVNLESTGGDVLELASIQNVEQFSKEDSRSLLKLPLGTTTAEIRANVTARYHLLLSDEWQLHVRSNVCLVLAPKIRPTLPPAIHTGALQERAESGWARFDKQEQLDSLRRSMTEILNQRAEDPLHMEAARELCRKSVAEFVRKWLLKEDHWRRDRFSAVTVLFPDEYPKSESGGFDQVVSSPTLLLD